jgi:sugar lactone lactonase YvrE
MTLNVMSSIGPCLGPGFSRPASAPGFSRGYTLPPRFRLQPALAGLAGKGNWESTCVPLPCRQCGRSRSNTAHRGEGDQCGSPNVHIGIFPKPIRKRYRPTRLLARIVPGLVASALLLLATGCAQQNVALLVPPEPPIVWPKPPDAPHVRYLGELKSSTDLHAPKPAGQVWRELLYGPEAPSILVKPHAVAVSADGNRLAVTDTDSACVHVFELDPRRYQRIEGWGGPNQRFECPTGVAWDGNTLWVADSKLHAVAMIPPGGAGRLIGADLLRRPAGLAFSSSTGQAYVADAGGHAIVAFDRQGKEVLRFGKQGTIPGELNYPGHLAVAPDGTLVVADSLNFRVQRFGPEGNPLGAFGQKGDAPGDFSLPKGVAVGLDGNIWVVDASFENLQAFTPSGQLLMAFGEEGQKPGEFWLPAGACIDAKGRLWVADTYNRRVQVFELLP